MKKIKIPCPDTAKEMRYPAHNGRPSGMCVPQPHSGLLPVNMIVTALQSVAGSVKPSAQFAYRHDTHSAALSAYLSSFAATVRRKTMTLIRKVENTVMNMRGT